MAAWILISILVLIIVFGIIFMVRTKNGKTKPETDYYALFLMGAVWLPIGIIQMAQEGYSVFFPLGLIFFITGLANKDKWKKNHKSWKDLKDKEKKIKRFLILLSILLIILGLLIIFYKLFI